MGGVWSGIIEDSPFLAASLMDSTDQNQKEKELETLETLAAFEVIEWEDHVRLHQNLLQELKSKINFFNQSNNDNSNCLFFKSKKALLQHQTAKECADEKITNDDPKKEKEEGGNNNKKQVLIKNIVEFDKSVLRKIVTSGKKSWKSGDALFMALESKFKHFCQTDEEDDRSEENDHQSPIF